MTLIGIDASRAATGQRTGTEAYAYYLIQALIPQAAAAGHRLRLYFNQRPTPGLFPETTAVTHVNIPFPRLWTHLRLAAELHRRPPDIFFTPAHVIPYTYPGPSVATVHDLGFHHFPEAHPRRQRLYLRWSTRHNACRSRRVLVDSQATRADLMQIVHTPPAKIDVVYPGIDPDLQPVTDPTLIAETSRRYGITPPYLLYIGTIQPRKNLVRLVKAFSAAEVDQQLVLAGKMGWLSRPTREAINDLPLNVQKRIILPGFVPDADKAALLSGATALLFPSLHEGFGFPLLEAQVCATAVLTATTSSLPEVAGSGALLVDPLDTGAIADGIRRLTTDDDLRRQLIAAGRHNVKRFTWETAASQTLTALLAAAQ